MKAKISAIFSLLLAFNMTCMSVSASLTGDINNDGKITITDLTALQKYMLSGTGLEGESRVNADINNDGIINILDFIQAKKMFISEISSDNPDTTVSVAEPEFSKESGFYDSDISVLLSAPAGVKIYYTTDGSRPTAESELYTGELKITDRSSQPNVYASITDVSNDNFTPPSVTKGTCVRAIAVDADGNESVVVSKTYFCGIDIAEKYNNFPVLCVTADPDDLFGYENGIYVRGKIYDDWKQSGDNQFGMNTWQYPGNYTQRGKEWERQVNVQLFENDGQLALNQDLGVRIKGNATRSSVIKSLKFYAREEYGKKNVKYNLIPGTCKEIDDVTPLKKYKTFVMRNGGNDLGYAQFRDNYIQSLVGDRAVETQSSRPAVMFINGEYWGIYCLQEDYSDSYIENNYDIDKKNVVIIECGEVDEGEEEDIALYNDFLSFAVNNNLSDTANYEKISEMMDIQSFIDYYCTEIFIANQDWMNNNNNYRLWRSRTVSENPYEDGKWRWMLYDTEYSTGLYSFNGNNSNYDSFKYALNGPDDKSLKNDYTKLFSALMENNEFKQRFVTTFSDIMNCNLSKSNMLTVLNQFDEMYKPVMTEHLKRIKSTSNGWGGGNWGGFWPGQQPGTNDESQVLSSYTQEVEKIRGFIQQREDNIYKFMTQYLNVGNTKGTLDIKTNDSSAGSIKVNTITPEFNNNEWSGTYVTDYPVTITAEPADGYKFAGFIIDGKEISDSTVSVEISASTEIEVRFTK